MDIPTATFITTVIGVVVTGMLGLLGLVVQIIVAIKK